MTLGRWRRRDVAFLSTSGYLAGSFQIMTSDQKRIQGVFNKLHRLLKQVSNNPKPERVHHLRTSIRRIETLLTSSPNGQSKSSEKLLKQMAKIRKRAGEARDAEVLIGKLKSLNMDTIEQDKERVLRTMDKTRRKCLKKLSGALDSKTVAELRKRLARAREELLAASPAETRGKVVADPVAFSLERFALLTQEWPKITEQNLHGFRKECKHIRYVAELAEGKPQAKPVLVALKNIQDTAGDWHDWLTLREVAENTLSDGKRPVLIGVLRARTRSKLAEALRSTEEEKKKLLGMHAQLCVRKGPSSAPKKQASAQATA